MKRFGRFWALLISVCFLDACANSYSPPQWLQGDWSNQGHSNSYHRWKFTSDNIHHWVYRNGQVDSSMDYSEYGYQERIEEDEYRLISPLNDSWIDIFTKSGDLMRWKFKKSGSLTDHGFFKRIGAR